MSYVVLARKWRPQTFSDLVGQGHVASTLGNAIKSGRVAHAFLFTGVRGVGKTTSARILAKALNCMAGDGPTATPCMACPACKEITDGVDVDVQEIDGASYNGVDEVRRLQESLPYRPNRDRYKIFIVDEVHMLSNSAWNAFLKTLEEPPPHVKFIFATTEVHKVPVTILSRVQRFDFKLIGTRLITERLRWVLGKEGIAADDAALAVIAREAAGSMRDAMSLLDQVIAWSAQTLTEEAVSQVLGVASRKILYDLVAELIAGRPSPILTIIDSLANQGFDITHVTRDLLAVLRDVVVVKSAESAAQLVDLPDDERSHVQALARHDLDDLLRLHQGFSKGYDEVARSGQPRAALEMLLVRLARRPPLVPIEDLIERLIRLEKRLQQGSTRGPAGATSPSGGGTQAARGGPPPPARASAPAVSAPAVSAPMASAPAVSTAAMSPPVTSTPALNPPVASAPVASPPAVSSSGAAVSGSATHVEQSRGVSNSAPRSAVPPTQTSPTVDPTPVATLSAPPLETLSAVERWRRVVDKISLGDPKNGAFLAHAEVIETNRERIHLRYERDSVASMALEDRAIQTRIREIGAALFGTSPELILAPREPDTSLKPTSSKPERSVSNGAQPSDEGPQSVFSVDREQREQREQAALAEARNHPMVQEAVRVLGARIKNIELPKS